MRLGFMLYPDSELDSAVQRWQRYGLRVLWWPDDETVILGPPGVARAQVMLENHPAEHRLGPGPVFIVGAADEFRAEHSGFEWLLDPCDVPAGRYAAYTEPSGSTIRILDLRNDLGERNILFGSAS